MKKDLHKEQAVLTQPGKSPVLWTPSTARNTDSTRKLQEDMDALQKP